MAEANTAVVCYIPGKLGAFVDRLRHRFDPALASWLAHVTILPPRALEDPLEAPLQTIRKRCAVMQPFEVAIGGVSTFWPVSGVVYLAVSSGLERLLELHEALNWGGLVSPEVHPYVPHVTIAQELDDARTQAVLAEVTREWSLYEGDPSFRLESLCLVQHTSDNLWVDLATIPLGRELAPTSRRD